MIARVRAAAVIVAALLPAACAVPLAPHCPAPMQDMEVSTLYFGMQTPSSLVSAAAWQRFVDEVVTPRFEAGLTHWPASGQWKSADGEILREPSRVLLLLHPGDRASRDGIDRIVEEYRTRFDQESVLVTGQRVCASF